jgi:RNA polymerase sigma-70 factor (ECF subfamily)
MNAIASTTYQPGFMYNTLENKAISRREAAQPVATDMEARRKAVQDLYEATVEQIYKFVYFKVGNREDAEDITSQVFIKAANLLDITQDERTRLAWLYQVARTTITDYWRQFYKAPSASLDAMEEASAFQIADEPMILSAPADENGTSVATVEALLAKLPENYRKVLKFRFLKSYTLKETAAAMGITEANVKVLQHRALQKAAKLGA